MSFKKIILFSSFLVIFGFLFNFNVPAVKAATVEELLAKIQQIQTQILLLQGQLAELQGQPSEWCHDFNTNIKWKDTGNEVEALQTVLEREGFQILADEKTNKYFYTSTLEAAMDFQCKYKTDISKYAGYEIDCTGFLGLGTRAQLNGLYGCKVKPYITVLSPNGGESWVIGNTYTISWNHNFSQRKEYVGKITLLKGESFYGDIASITSGATGYPWQVGNIKGGVGTGNDYKVKIEFTNQSGKIIATDISDNYFSIVSTTTTCTDSDDFGNSVNYYTKGSIYTCTGGVCTLPVDDFCTDQSNLKEYYCGKDNMIGSVIYYCLSGCQDGVCLSTTTPSITVISPNGGEGWVIGNTYEISWSCKNIPTNDYLVKITLAKGGVFYGTINEGARGNVSGYPYAEGCTTHPTDGYLWEVGNMKGGVGEGSNYQIKVGFFRPTGEAITNDISDNYFSIVSTSTPCTDSDGGLNYYVKGVVKMTQGPVLELYDACADSNLLQERVCNSNTDYLQNTVNFTCLSGCQDGACIQVVPPSITSISPISGTANDIITIYGKNLFGTKPSGIIVEFLENGLLTGSIGSPITESSDGSYLKFLLSNTFVGMQGPGTYQVRATNDYGKSNTVNFSIVAATSSRQDVFLINLTNYNNIVSWEVVQKPAAGSPPSGLTYYWIYKIKNISDYKIKLNYKAVNSITGEDLAGLGGGAIVLIGNPDTYYSLGSTVPLDKGQTHELHFSLTLSSSVKPEDFALRITLESVEQVTLPNAVILVPGYDFYVRTSDTGTGNWSFAKSSCESLGSGWSLPTMDQLRVLYQKKNEIGGFRDETYWSLDMGKYIHFSNGFESSMNPAMTFPAFRCVKKVDGIGLEYTKDQLASLAEAISKLIEQIKNLIVR